MSHISESPSAALTGGGAREIMLFGVRLSADPLRKSVSMNNLSDYESVTRTNDLSTNHELIKVDDGGAAGYASADDIMPLPSSGSRERKRGVPWTEEEHKLFLIGLNKIGKGDWRGIARNYVKTRTPTQVASHAQKYFLRRASTNGRRRRSSLFDITTDTVNQMPVEEVRNNQESPPQQTTMPMQVTSNINGISVVPFPVMFTMQGGNPMESSSVVRSDGVNVSSPMLIDPVPVLLMPTRMMIDLNSNQQVPIEPSHLSLNLSLMSWGQGQSATKDVALSVMSASKMGTAF